MNTITRFLLVVLLVGACARAPTNVETVAAYERHKNEGNLEAALALFADDATMNFGPLGTLEGIQQVRGIHEYDQALNTVVNFRDCRETGSEVSCYASESNDWLGLVGVTSVQYDEARFGFAGDGRINRVTARLSPDSLAALGAAMTEFDGWARVNEPDAYAALFAGNGEFVYSHANGNAVMALLRRWQASE